MIRVFIADDHAVVREGLRGMLATADGLELAGEAADGRAVLEALDHTPVDVLVLDLSLPRVSGLEVLRRVAREHPGVKVLVLSMYPEDQYARRMRREGAAGYLGKERPLGDVERAIRAVAAGRSLEPKTEDSSSRPAGAPHETLSAREYQVFLLLLQGRANADIAAELDLVPSTVSNHTARVKQKLGAKTLAEVVSYAHRMGLVD